MRTWLPVLLDVLLVTAVALLGIAAHRGGAAADDLFTPANMARVAVPFALGCLAGWALPEVRKNPLSISSGLRVMGMSVLVGVLIRVSVLGDTAHWSMVLVTITFTTLFLLGWRLLARAAGRTGDRVGSRRDDRTGNRAPAPTAK